MTVAVTVVGTTRPDVNVNGRTDQHDEETNARNEEINDDLKAENEALKKTFATSKPGQQGDVGRRGSRELDGGREVE